MIRLLFILLCFSLPAHADDFFTTDLQGKAVKLSSYRGKWVLVNFWSMSDPASRAELPELDALSKAHKDLVVIGVVMNYGNAKSVGDFAKANRMRYTIVPGNDDIVDQIGGLRGLPANFLYNPSGDLTAAKTGPITRSDIERLIR